MKEDVQLIAGNGSGGVWLKKRYGFKISSDGSFCSTAVTNHSRSFRGLIDSLILKDMLQSMKTDLKMLKTILCQHSPLMLIMLHIPISRRFINMGELPPADAVRIEEMINYFKYDYPEPEGEHPFSVYTELAVCPWNKKHQLLQVGLRGKSIDKSSLPPSNLVFLIDVSGSMNDPNKLPLLKSAFGLLVNELRPQDSVAIVVYAGAAGLVLESTPGKQERNNTCSN